MVTNAITVAAFIIIQQKSFTCFGNILDGVTNSQTFP